MKKIDRLTWLCMKYNNNIKRDGSAQYFGMWNHTCTAHKGSTYTRTIMRNKMYVIGARLLRAHLSRFK